MKEIMKKCGKTLLLPVIVYGVFLIICFKRFNNLNCVYTIFLQSIVPTITAYAYAFIYMSGLFDFTIGSRIIIGGLVGGIASARTSDWGAGGKRPGSGAHRNPELDLQDSFPDSYDGSDNDF